MITSNHLDVLPDLRHIISSHLAGPGSRTGKDQEEDRMLLEGLNKLQEIWAKKDEEEAAWRTEEFEDECARNERLRTFRIPMSQTEKGN